MTRNKKEIIEISGLSEISDQYNAFLIDLWGVVHNGISLFPDILSLLKKLKDHNKQVIFITNAPRRSVTIKEQLNQFGINSSLFSDVISSGEISWLRMKTMILDKKNNCFHIGPQRDNHLTEGLNINLVKEPNKTDFILNTGPWGDNDSLENYKEILSKLYEFKALMICANPDKRVIRGKNFMICAGLLAEYYENLGGKVEYFGKPFSEIYEYGLKLLIETDKKKVLIIGDSLGNDIKGAINQCIDSLLVTDGIHRDVNNNKNIDLKKLNDLMTKKNIYANYVIKELTWK